MRFFIALEIPEENSQQIVAVQQKVRELVPKARLTDPAKFHLTVAFVGEQPEELRYQLDRIISQCVVDIKPFSVTPAYIDGFPSFHQPNIFWVGVKGDIDKLIVLRERIKDGLTSLNIEVDERRYTPHIAIAKVRNYHLPKDVEEELEEMMISHKFNPIQITAVKLFQSIPNHGFHEHNTLAEIKL